MRNVPQDPMSSNEKSSLEKTGALEAKQQKDLLSSIVIFGQNTVKNIKNYKSDAEKGLANLIGADSVILSNNGLVANYGSSKLFVDKNGKVGFSHTSGDFKIVAKSGSVGFEWTFWTA